MSERPVILLAFADDRASADRHLAGLSKEQALLQSALAPAVKADLCEVETLTNATVEGVIDAFQQSRFRDRIAVFHFAGHADGYQLLLETFDEGNIVAHGAGLVSFFSRQNGLRLIFLNGCSTQRQAQELVEAGVPAVIGTYMPIEDDKATLISSRFYRGLGQGHGIDRAWQEACDEIRIRVGEGLTRDLVFQSIADLPGSPVGQFPWQIYYRPGAEIVREWNLPKAANNPLFGLPEIAHLHKLPKKPYLFLRRFERKHAAIFFGRGQEIRDLYQRLSDPNAMPILLLHGQSGVGKSSLLEAGVLPRLEQKHQAIYLRRDPDLGLRQTVRNAISSGREMSVEEIRQYWRRREQEVGKPLVLILDQVEEVFTRPIDNQKEELREFLQFVRDVLDVPQHQPRGKLVLSYRKEFHPEIEQICKQLEIPRDQVYIDKLTRQGVVEIITGLEFDEYLYDFYQLKVEKRLPEIIADDLLADRDSPIAPVLQILLTKMWDMTEAGTTPYFNNEKYLELQKAGVLMEDFFHEQMKQMRIWNPEAIDSGLALDMLNLHTTDMGTARSRSLVELQRIYAHQASVVDELVRRFKESYLLTDRAESESGLAHDTLAPLVQKEIRNSEKPGQRAFRILQAKMLEYRQEPERTFIDEEDLSVVEEGIGGMRSWSEEEKTLVEKSRKRRDALVAGRRRNRRFRRAMFGIVAAAALTIAFFAWDQYWTAKANSLTDKALQMEGKDASIALRLAEAAVNAKPANANAKQALRDVFNNNIFYQHSFLHRKPVSVVAISSDGRFALTSSQDKTARLWNRDGALLALLKGHSDEIISSAISPDDQYILTSGKDNTIIIWDSLGDSIRTIASGNAPIRSLTFLPGGRAFMGGGYQKVFFWDLQGKPLGALDRLQGFVTTTAVSGDGRWYLAAGDETNIVLWDSSGTEDIRILPHNAPVKSAIFCGGEQNNSYVLSTAGIEAYLWNFRSGDSIPPIVFSGHSEPVSQAVYSPLENLVYTLAEDATLRRWNRLGVEIDRLFGHEQNVNILAISSNGRFMLSGSEDRTAKLWKVRGKEKRRYSDFDESISAIEVSPDGSYFVAAYGHRIRLTPIGEGDALELEGHSDKIADVAVSTDGGELLSGGADSLAILWAVNGERLEVYSAPEAVVAVAYSTERQLAIAGGQSGNIYLWSRESAGSAPKIFEAPVPNRQIRSLEFSADGSRILSCGSDEYSRIWSVEGELLTSIPESGAYVMDAAWSADEKFIVAANNNASAKLHSANGRLIAEFIGHQPKTITEMRFGRMISRETKSVNSVAFSPSGKRVLTSGVDHTARIWELSGDQLQVIAGHDGQVNEAVFSPDGDFVFSGGADSTVLTTYTAASFLDSDQVIALNYGQAADYQVKQKNFNAYLLAGSIEELLAYAYYFEAKAMAMANHSERVQNLNRAVRLYDAFAARSKPQLQDEVEAAEIYLRYAESLLYAGRYRSSVAYFSKARERAQDWFNYELSPDRGVIPMVAAQVLQGRLDASMQMYGAFIQTDPTERQAFFFRFFDELIQKLQIEYPGLDRSRIEAFKQAAGELD